MAKIKHIALTTENPGEVAEFYRNAFDMEEIRRSDNSAVFLSDGYIKLAILNWKTEKDADVGPNYNDIHHIGFQIEDLDQACEKLSDVNGEELNSRDGLNTAMGAGPASFQMKWAGPNGVVIDISHTSWATSEIPLV